MSVLSDGEIREEVKQNSLLDPFSNENAQGASYDIRAGATAILVEPEEPKGKGRLYYDLKQQKTIRVKPGYSCTIYSLEKVKLPSNMMGFLHNRMRWVHERLNFDGGIVSPGYHGLLFMTFTNLGDREVKINYGEPLVALVFARLSKNANKPNVGTPIMELPEDKLPGSPEGLRYDAIELSTRIDELESRCKERGPSVESTKRIMDSVVLAGVAGLVAGALVVVYPRIPSPYNMVIVGFAGSIGFIKLVFGRR